MNLTELQKKYTPATIRRVFGKNLRQLAKSGQRLRKPRKPAPWFRAELRRRQNKARDYRPLKETFREDA